ncbi:MAG: DEAD/DEAH box helicase [Propionicimonas sp.]|uniref:DEAD/DEAH box helicase n=1 Tax=Propionicimonas sp. TaxID=1955623 RepID=UPI002B1F9681|nr:DEAD/DEAH box helicase [Propionicimonas sp.]MEA4944165.1 DEAD/DEAH box helicase [Propionicimonas sp.]MEA5053303.1 DEAD/DEAH box helicase [Propionicimonas sp.]MEA5119579.1 DEAD/DEAH box helicase [Propionicimonas sp.]
MALNTDLNEPAVKADENHTFADLGVVEPITQALEAVGITHPFPIQSLAIPIAIAGTDMIGQARTGTGKTLAFGITLLQRILVAGDEGYEQAPFKDLPQALVMTPTRELALQVSRDLEVASSVRKARVLTVYGGVGYEPQLDALADGVDVVVGTPGRLLDLVQRRNLNLAHVKVLVLDEADEMLDLGFLPDVERLISKTPHSRQTLLFSATMPAAVMALARMHLNQPVNVRAETRDAQLTVPDTTQFVYQAHDLDKPEIVGRVLQAEGRGRTMIFTRTKRAAQRLADELVDRGFSATSLHGDLTQVLREKALKKFREGKVDVLVATDVAARGIDITDVTHVINYECPDDDKTYVHRIGRTGRAGAKGVAITLVDWADITRWKVINKALDLPFTEIPETYSTSPHLLTDLNIPAGTRGRLKEAAPQPPREPRERRDRGRRSDDKPRDGEKRGDGEKRDSRPRQNRNRRRTRNGRPVERPSEPATE